MQLRIDERIARRGTHGTHLMDFRHANEEHNRYIIVLERLQHCMYVRGRYRE